MLPGFDHQKKAHTFALEPNDPGGSKSGFHRESSVCTALSLPTPLFLCTYIYIFRDGFMNAINIRTVSVTLQIHWHRKKRVATYQLRYVKAAERPEGLLVTLT